MTTRYVIRAVSFAVSVLAFALSGCTALKTFPQTARAGDTVALAVGSADGMTRANTTAYFVSNSSSVQYNLTPTIRGIFKLYADKASVIYQAGSNSRTVVDTSGHEQWVTIMVIDLPQGLPTGTGTVHITTTATYPTIGSNINNLPIGLEIIPGTGAASSLSYEFGVGTSMAGDLTQVEAVPHAQVIPVFPSSTAWPAYGAIEMKLYVPTSAGTALDPPRLRVLVDDLSISTSSSLNTSYRHDSNQNLTVLLLSPSGRLQYYESRFAIALRNDLDPPLSFAGTPVITSVRYFDINGNLVAGPPITDFVVQLR